MNISLLFCTVSAGTCTTMTSGDSSDEAADRDAPGARTSSCRSVTGDSGALWPKPAASAARQLPGLLLPVLSSEVLSIMLAASLLMTL